MGEKKPKIIHLIFPLKQNSDSTGPNSPLYPVPSSQFCFVPQMRCPLMPHPLPSTPNGELHYLSTGVSTPGLSLTTLHFLGTVRKVFSYKLYSVAPIAPRSPWHSSEVLL